MQKTSQIVPRASLPAGQASGVRKGRNATAMGLRVLPSVLGLAALAVMAALYLQARPAYFSTLHYFGFGAFRFPFLDTSFILSNIECWRHGVDVYRINPCDVLGRKFDYSPLWLRLAVFPISSSWRNAVGLTVGAAFFLSLLCLPPVRKPWHTAVIVLCSLSSVSAFAVERGNCDIIMFGLAAVAGVLYQRGPVLRCVGYAVSLLAGLLKFYPLILLVWALRERFRRFLLVGAACGAAVAFLTWYFLPELRGTMPNIARGAYFGVTFGAVNLPYGAVALAGYARPALQGTLGNAIAITGLLCLVGVTVLTAAGFARRQSFGASLAGMDPASRTFLVIGAALCVGCFFAWQCIEYRAIHLIFVVSGLLALSTSAEGSTRKTFRRALVIACLLMWDGTLRRIAPGAVQAGTGVPAWVVFVLVWLLRELCWWWLMGVLAGILLCFALQSETWTVLRELPAFRWIDAGLAGRAATGPAARDWHEPRDHAEVQAAMPRHRLSA